MVNLTLGQKLNNPFCVKTPSSGPWMGQIGKDKHGHAIFSDPKYSARAACSIISRYYTHKSAKTLLDVFRIYAPADDTLGSIEGSAAYNSPSDYAQYVAKACGINYNDPFPLFDDKGNVTNKILLATALHAMAQYESRWKLPPQTILEGIELYKEKIRTK